MKKIMLAIMMLMIMPGIVNAESCKIVSNRDKIIVGDEVICGTEHFYVTSTDGKKVKMLSKNLLNVGYVVYEQKNVTKDNMPELILSYIEDTYAEEDPEIDPEPTEPEPTEPDPADPESPITPEGPEVLGAAREDHVLEFLNNLNEYNAKNMWFDIISGTSSSDNFIAELDEKYPEWKKLYGAELYETYPELRGILNDYYASFPIISGWVEEDGSVTLKWYVPLDIADALQNDGVLPQSDENLEYTVKYVVPSYYYQNILNNDYRYNKEYNADGILNLSLKAPYVNAYKNSLTNMGYKVEDVELFNVNDYLDLLATITNGELTPDNIFELMKKDANGLSSINLKEILKDEYEWLFASSYWLWTDLETLDGITEAELGNDYGLFYADLLGNFYAMGYNTIKDMSMGIRPLVTMSIDDIDIIVEKEGALGDKLDPEDAKNDIENPKTGLFASLMLIPLGLVGYVIFINIKKHRLFRQF